MRNSVALAHAIVNEKFLERLARMGFTTMENFIWSSFFGLIGAKNYSRTSWSLELEKSEKKVNKMIE